MRVRIVLPWFCIFNLLISKAEGQVKQIDSLKIVLTHYAPTDTGYANTLNEIAFTYWNIQVDSLIALSIKSENLCHKIGFAKGEAEAIKNIGIGYRIKGLHDEALKHLLRALPLAESAKYYKGIGGCYNNIAIIYNNRGAYWEALKFHAKAVEIREKIGDKKDVSASYNNMGIVYTNIGRYSDALEYHLKSLRIREQINDKVGIAMSLNNLANMYDRLEQYEKAMGYLTRALKIEKEIGDKDGTASSLTNIGSLYLEQGKDSSALDFQLHALQEVQPSNQQLVARILIKIAFIYFKRHEISKSLDYYARTRSKMEMINDKSGLSEVFNGLAQVSLYQKNYNEALAYAKESLKLGTDNLERIKASSLTLSETYEAIGKGTDALYYYKQFKLYSDSLNSKDDERKATLLQAQYDYEKKEMLLKDQQRLKEVEFERKTTQQRWIIFSAVLILCSVSAMAVYILRSREKIKRAYDKLEEVSLEIRKQKEELHVMNILKERLLSVVSHDARGPLTSLSGILNLLSSDSISLEESKKILSQINVHLLQVRDFLETLLHWVKQQVVDATPNIKIFKLNSIISQTFDLIKPVADLKSINITTQVEDEHWIQGDEEMIRIVLRNLLSNAIKFCRKNDTVEILVSADHKSNFVKISVNDRGVGISKDGLSKLFGIEHLSTKGTNDEIGTGLGLLLCKSYVELNGGQVGVESEVDKGSSFWFTLPMAVAEVSILI